ncbi:MAG: DinB family protein [Planctomycetaceae bacterium]
MNAVHLLQRLHQHRAWVNASLLTASATLSDEKLRSPYQIGQGSVWKSLTHLYGAEYVWLEALLGNEDSLVPGDVAGKLPGNQQGEGGIRGVEDLRLKWHALDQRWTNYLGSLTPESLEDGVARKSSSTGQRFITGRADVLLHVCTHAHYTAAQVINMLRQAGVDKLPETMLISMARQEAT